MVPNPEFINVHGNGCMCDEICHIYNLGVSVCGGRLEGEGLEVWGVGLGVGGLERIVATCSSSLVCETPSRVEG